MSKSEEIDPHERMRIGYQVCSGYNLIDTLSASYMEDLKRYLKASLRSGSFQKHVFFTMIFGWQYLWNVYPPRSESKLKKLVTEKGEKEAFIFLTGATLYELEQQTEAPEYPMP